MKPFLLTFICIFIVKCTFAQTTPGPVEKQLTDSICACLTLVNVDNIHNKKEATDVFGNCFVKRSDLLMKVADERHVDPTDQPAMRQIGIDIGKALFNINCQAFTKISLKMVEDKDIAAEGHEGNTTGKIKRMDVKGFNYLVISDNNNSEKSFIWLRQFPGSEMFENGVLKYSGKEVNIKWQEIEVYLPQAKGYYKIKEITGIAIK